MNITRQHFELIAQVMRDNAPAYADQRELHQNIVLAFSEELARHNPRFDSKKFIEACGY